MLETIIGIDETDTTREKGIVRVVVVLVLVDVVVVETLLFLVRLLSQSIYWFVSDFYTTVGMARGQGIVRVVVRLLLILTFLFVENNQNTWNKTDFPPPLCMYRLTKDNCESRLNIPHSNQLY